MFEQRLLFLNNMRSHVTVIKSATVLLFLLFLVQLLHRLFPMPGLDVIYVDWIWILISLLLLGSYAAVVTWMFSTTSTSKKVFSSLTVLILGLIGLCFWLHEAEVELKKSGRK